MVLCANAHIQVPDALREADQLTPYAAALRYGDEDIDLVDRSTALNWVTAAVEWARGMVEPATKKQPEESTEKAGDSAP